MSLHVHVWDSANGTACGACGEYHPSVYRCSFDGCDYKMWDAAYGDIEDHWRGHVPPSAPPGLDVDDLAMFFHEEYWAETNDPHWPREKADATDCEVCWRSAAKLIARLEQDHD